MPTKKLIIKGKVQGVFYRASAKVIADQIGITGWIRNSENGEVETVIKGSDEQLRQFINWAWQGPVRSKVVDVVCVNMSDEIYSSFNIK